MRHLRAFTLSLPAFVFLGLSSAALAQSADAPTHPWTVKEIFDDRSLTGDAPEGMSWSPDGTRATYIADNGFAGTAINTVCRLRDCHEAKDALSGTESDLVLVVSDRIYQDVIRGYDTLDLPPSGFTEAVVHMPDKEFQAKAYVFTGDG